MEQPLKKMSQEVEEQLKNQPTAKTVTKEVTEEILEPIKNDGGEDTFIIPNPTVVQGRSPAWTAGWKIILTTSEQRWN